MVWTHGSGVIWECRGEQTHPALNSQHTHHSVFPLPSLSFLSHQAPPMKFKFFFSSQWNTQTSRGFGFPFQRHAVREKGVNSSGSHEAKWNLNVLRLLSFVLSFFRSFCLSFLIFSCCSVVHNNVVNNWPHQLSTVVYERQLSRFLFRCASNVGLLYRKGQPGHPALKKLKDLTSNP